MSEKNIELMKKIIEKKNLKNSQQGSIGRPEKNIGSSAKAHRNTKQGGLFDK